MEDRIRVAQLVYQLGAGGAENGIVNLMNHISQDIFEPMIITYSKNGPLTARLDRKAVTIIEMNKKGGNDVILLFKLYRLLKRIKPHIVHTHGWGTLVEGISAAKLARVPAIIHSEHGTIEGRKKNILIQRMFWGLSDEVISISESLRYRLSEKIGFDASRIRPVMNGVDVEKFRPGGNRDEHRRKLHLPKDAFVVGTVGRLVLVKDQATFIDAISLVRKRRSQERVMGMIVGEGPLQGSLIERAKSLGIGDDIIMLGRRDDIPAILNSLDLFILSSISEGISNTILEAMACALPIIATKVGGTVEIVNQEEEGLLVPPQDINELAESILRFMNNADLRKRCGERARESAVTRFSLSRMVKTYEDIYLRVLYEKAVVP